LPQIINEEETSSKAQGGGLHFLSGFFGRNEKVTPKQRRGDGRVTRVHHGDPFGSRTNTTPAPSTMLDRNSEMQYTEIPMRLLMKRKAKTIIEPKVPLANERTLLAWFHWATLIAGASLALSSFDSVEKQPLKQLYGLMLIPLAIAIIVYALNQCKFRCYRTT
jgi:hypothetical protein